MKEIIHRGALTVKHNGLAREIHSPVHLQPAGNTENSKMVNFDGLWDTGATNTVITQKVVETLGLKQTGITEVYTPQGSHKTPTYLVELIFLDSKLRFKAVNVSLGKLSNCDVLIGMDIISNGDFVITNKKQKTVFTFQVPSTRELDFVEQIEEEKTKRHLILKPMRKKRGKKNRR